MAPTYISAVWTREGSVHWRPDAEKGQIRTRRRGISLFLDEIGDISLELQPKLLRAAQERECERLGSARTMHVNVRMIAATHRDLPNMIRNNQFREDLSYRLNVFPIEVPSLRERREDILLPPNAQGHSVSSEISDGGARERRLAREYSKTAWAG